MVRKSLVAIFLSIPLTSCAQQEVSSGQIENVSQRDDLNSESKIETGLISISSDNVAAAGYSESQRVMTVQFENGAQYEYYNVPLELWESFLAAQPHPWSQVGYPQLVGEGYSYRRIN
jgi:hypothetical protein